MAALSCYRCGASLAELSLPLARRDECPKCRVELHVCRMCVHYAPRLSRGCDEDDAPDVRDKETANFCDYYKPSPDAFDAGRASAESAARAELAKLFGEPGPGEKGTDEGGPDENGLSDKRVDDKGVDDKGVDDKSVDDKNLDAEEANESGRDAARKPAETSGDPRAAAEALFKR